MSAERNIPKAQTFPARHLRWHRKLARQVSSRKEVRSFRADHMREALHPLYHCALILRRHGAHDHARRQTSISVREPWRSTLDKRQIIEDGTRVPVHRTFGQVSLSSRNF